MEPNQEEPKEKQSKGKETETKDENKNNEENKIKVPKTEEEKRALEFLEKKEREKKEEEERMRKEEETKKKMEEKAKEIKQEQKEGDGKKEDVPDGGSAAKEFLKDVVENEVERVELIEDTTDKRDFTKPLEPEKFEYSFGELDKFLHYEYRDVRPIYRYSVEMVLVTFFLMVLPIILVLIVENPGFKEIFSVFLNIKNPRVKTFFKFCCFIAMTYDIFILSKIFMDNLLYVFVWLLTLLDVRIEGAIATALQIICSSTDNLKNTIATLFVFFVASELLGGYTPFKTEMDINHLILTIMLWYVCFSFMLFLENLIMNIFFGEIGRGSFAGRIYDANSKTFVFKKLLAISMKKLEGKKAMDKVINEMINDYESSIFLKHASLNLVSKEAAVEIAESIFGYLGIKQLEYKKIKKFFPDIYEDVYRYLSQGRTEKKEPVSFDTFKEQCINLYQERVDIALSLSDRDKILSRLNVVLLFGVYFLGLVLFLMLLNVDYKVYLASLGPFLFAFGWIFQDSIKELYRCFVFLLISHPFDNGDRIVINNEELKVANIDLFYTSFYNNNGRVVYMPNLFLATQKIFNLRRSLHESETVELLIASSTSFDNILKFKDNLSEELKKIAREFTGQVLIIKSELAGDSIKLSVNIQYNTNLQDFLPNFARHELLIKTLKESLGSCSIGHKDTFVFIT